MKRWAAAARCHCEWTRRAKPMARRCCGWRWKLIETAQVGRVLLITLNRPEKRNALNLALCEELVRAIDSADPDPNVGAIVLNANGPSFCAGMDLKESGH